MNKPDRRKILSILSLASAGMFIPFPGKSKAFIKPSKFKFCLNTSTISGQNPGLVNYIKIAGGAGYEGIELWVRDVKAYLEAGNSASNLKRFIKEQGLKVENAIGFAPWINGGKEGMDQMKSEMEMMASIGCSRIAAPPAGVQGDKPLDFLMVGEKYAEILELGRSTGVMPQLEFWGASKVMWHLGQAMMAATAANDPDARLLPDVYHLFRGGSGFEGLKMLNGNMIEIFHMNDYPATIPRESQVDADRVYPGDGVAPLKQILTDLKTMDGEKVLSLELFNKKYWKVDPLTVAKTGLQKMKSAVSKIKAN